MLEVTSQANTKLVEYMQENNLTSPLRVFISSGGCSGPALALALDEEKQGDQVFNQKDLVILVEKNIIDQCGSITVDYIDAGNRSGFSIQSANPLPGGGGCSSGSCGSEGCGC
jgi:iron-sulfur cluster assembly accessory protein